MKSLKYRYFFVSVIVTLVVISMIIRLVYLMVYKHNFYLDRSNKQIQKLIKIDTSRGKIFDRNMYPLAVSQPMYSVYASPKNIDDKDGFSKQISSLLGMSQEEILSKIDNDANFVWLKRKTNDINVDDIRSFPPMQINVLSEEKRFYPNQSSVSDVLGFVGMDAGLAGLEYQFDQFLTGEQGFYIIQGDPRGVRIISSDKTLIGKVKGFSHGDSGIEASSLRGGNLVMTIDYRIQFFIEKLLKENIEKVEAESGQVIVMDVTNGDIIAMANYPYFNPNHYDQDPYSILKNSCVVDVFEPGSTFKLITYAAALEEKVVTPGMMVEIPETITIAKRTIKEPHKREPDAPTEYAARDIIKKSMNVGTVLLAEQLGRDVFFDYIDGFGFGKKTGIYLPGETNGLLRNREDITPIDNAVMSFGQGLSVTSLQMVTAISTIANRGVYVSPRIIKHQTDHDNLTLINPSRYRQHRVISSKTARDVLSAMELVVTEGTGYYARVPGYRVGGKTGTAQKPLENGLGYEEDAYIASFLGVLPIQKPKFAILVTIDEPSTTIWGSTAAAPLFSEVSKVLIDYYDIEPDFSKMDYEL